MQEVLAVPSYTVAFLIISYVVSVLGSFAALTAASEIRQHNGRIDHTSLAVAAVSLGGVAIWSMHFVGMMAYRLPVTIAFSRIETIASLVAAIAVAWGALRFLASGAVTTTRLVVAGTITGLGVVVMHYLGMYGMRFSGYFEWNALEVGVSVLIALVAATVALWLAFTHATPLRRFGAAFLMGAAVCAMHYTGMDAASPMCRAISEPLDPSLWSRPDLQMPVLVGLGLSIVVIVTWSIRRISTSLEYTH